MQEHHGACVYEHKDMPDSLEHAKSHAILVLHRRELTGLTDV